MECPEDVREAIRRELKNLNLISFALGLPGLFLQFAAQPLYLNLFGRPRTEEELQTAVATILILRLLGVAMLIAGLGFSARYKNRSGTWGLMGLLSCIGLLVLYFISKYCRHCGQAGSYRVKACARCQAPM